MLLQIHDELIFEIPIDEEKNLVKLIINEMASVKDSDLHTFSTPLTVDVNTGENWGILHWLDFLPKLEQFSIFNSINDTNNSINRWW